MNKKTNNKISVIMGIYNCASTLPDAIDSIVNQTYTDWELIMCDDASTDDTYEVASSYQKKYPSKIKLIRSDRNMKLAYSLNKCLKIAEGFYIARMDGDDISLPDRFEKQVNYLQSNPDVHLVGTAMQQFNEKEYLNIVRTPEHTDKWTLHKTMPFNHATILTYKWVYDSLNGYTVEERTNRAEDYDLWFRFFSKGYIGDNIQEPLYLVKEDKSAFKRRTFKSRWLTFKTTKIGYKLLNYPRRWLLLEFADTFYKSITPAYVQYLYRNLQKKIR